MITAMVLALVLAIALGTLDDAAHGLTERKAVTTGKKFGDDDIVNLLGQNARRHAAYDFEGRVVVDAPEEADVS